ncbi:MAG: hypothetical protein K0R17_3030 [Rariglobus sp.]|jgi:hypothetical protein|nr:hypothetical protein [Rariglobus sp.]
MKTMTTCALAGVLLFATSAPMALAAFSVGESAYTKRLETAVLQEPAPLAKTVGKIGYARALKVEEVRGSWLLVSEGPVRGWVFSGNLAENKPSEKTSLGDVPLLASETSATAAARPLAPTTAGYGARHGLESANADLEWLVQKSNQQTPDKVTAYLQAEKKGEFSQ